MYCDSISKTSGWAHVFLNSLIAQLVKKMDNVLQLEKCINIAGITGPSKYYQPYEYCVYCHRRFGRDLAKEKKFYSLSEVMSSEDFGQLNSLFASRDGSDIQAGLAPILQHCK